MNLFRSAASFLIVASLVLGSQLGGTRCAHAQMMELSSSDLQAVLYAPQLNFTRGGDPLIRVHIVERQSKVSFTPSKAIRVLPRGEGGPVVELPAGRTYTVRIEDGKAGKFKHMVVVDRIPVSQRKRTAAAGKTWLKRGYMPEEVEVGGLFAVHGKVFDSRVILLAVGATDDLKKAKKIKAKLEGKFGIDGAIHSVVRKFPKGSIVLEGGGTSVVVRNQGVLWVAPMVGAEESTKFEIPRVPRSYGKGFETRRYVGTLVFAPDRDGSLLAMVSVGAERLLRGVVPAEIFSSAPKAALRAQAVAARNEIFSAVGVRNLGDPFMLRSDVMDQVYGGVGKEAASTNRAVAATRGKVMLHGKAIVHAFYSSNAGGYTENNENVWDMEARPYLRGRPDAPSGSVPKKFLDGISESELEAFLASKYPGHSKTAPVSSKKYYRWERDVDVKKPKKWLAKAGISIGEIRNARVVKRGVSGRVMTLELTGTKGSTTVERELNVRRLFGGLRSGLFVMAFDRDASGNITKFRFRGAGFGHGVGMCQTGATGMAAMGKTYTDILTHYYRGVSLEKLY